MCAVTLSVPCRHDSIVWVSDSRQPFVERQLRSPDVVYIKEREPLVFPCRVTNPNASVSLVKVSLLTRWQPISENLSRLGNKTLFCFDSIFFFHPLFSSTCQKKTVMTFLRVSISTHVRAKPSQVLLLLPIIQHIVIMAAFLPRSVCVRWFVSVCGYV